MPWRCIQAHFAEYLCWPCIDTGLDDYYVVIVLITTLLFAYTHALIGY